jgi:hypothetical protein
MSPPRRRSLGSTRLIVALAIAVALGAAAYLYVQARPSAPLRPRQPLTVIDPVRGAAEIPDLGPVAALRTSGGDPRTFEKAALDHILAVVASGKLPRRGGQVLSLEAAAALDPHVAAGQLIETVGFVKSLDREKFESAANPSWDQLWSFELGGESGAPAGSAGSGGRIVVIDPGDSRKLGGEPPSNATPEGTTPQPIKNGDRVRVRGVYVQRRTGGVGALNLDGPTAVLVGREYRVTAQGVLPPPEKLDEIAFKDVEDRFAGQTYDVADPVHWQLLAWARARGPAAIANDLSSGVLQATPWESSQFLRWKRELESDKGPSTPDDRPWTISRRGHVYALTGHLGEVASEDWADVPANPYDIDGRHVFWLLSDSYGGYALIPFYSAFGLDSFSSVPAPTHGKGDLTRVRVFGMFVRNYTYTLPGQERQEITVPSFQLLYIEKQ